MKILFYIYLFLVLFVFALILAGYRGHTCLTEKNTVGSTASKTKST
jgi:hypothetical protein